MAKLFSNYDCNKALKRLAAGDMTALSTVYDNTANLVFSLALTLLGNREDAEDVLQDTMIAVAQSAHSYENGSPKAWVLSIARNRAIDMLRKRRPTTEVTDTPVQDPQLISLEIADILNVLNEEEKQTVVLHIYGGMSHKEIGMVLNISPAAAQKKYRRAIEKLKKIM